MGIFSSAMVGIVLGMMGHALNDVLERTSSLYFICLMSIILAAREFGWIEFDLPECKRQTEKFWGNKFGICGASAMWGFHIGLGFATRITFGGFWILAITALAFGDPRFGAELLMMYWVGRVLSVWLAPSFCASAENIDELPERIYSELPLYHRIVGGLLLWTAGMLGFGSKLLDSR